MGNEDKNASKQATGEGDSIRVIVRVRPSDNKDDGGMCLDVDETRHMIHMHSKETKAFTFDQVCDNNTTQETVFRSVGKKIIDGCITGYNGTIFAYGQTGSGKTFTMLGPSEDADNFQHELRGVIPRSFEYLFSLIKSELEMHGDKVQFLTKCSFLEIYNENVFDLLDAASKGLHLRENIKKGVFVDGIIEQAVRNASEAYDVLSHGWTNRTVASTSMNRESSRSHAVFTLYIESKKMVNGVWNVRSSQLNLVDLAGSERQKDTNTAGMRLKEAGNINKSLSALGNVIMALVDICHGKTRHVPYRDSKLTFLLRDSLGGNAKTSIIACVHPGSRCFGETLSTLHFARRAKMIKNKAIVNEDMQGSVTLLQAEIKRLKETILAMQQQQGVPAPMGAGDNAPAPTGEKQGGEDGQVDGKYRAFFLDAMMFKQKSDGDRKAWIEKYNKLQETCNAKERALRQNKMVLKFREEAIKKLEKTVKEKGGLMDGDDKAAIIESLRGEIKALSAHVEHHPEVTRFRMEAENLKTELKRLKSQQTTLTGQKVAELEAEFKQLQLEMKKEGVAAVTPSQSSEKNVATATLERQKAQISKLQEELENEKKSKAELSDAHEKERVRLEAEIESLKVTNEELRKLNASTRSRYQVEREVRDDMHADTLKKMTTPKKAKYRLRNRTIIGPSSGQNTPVFNLDDSLGAGDDEAGILDESAPQELVEGQIEALKEENARLNDEIRSMSKQLSEQEDEKLKLVSDSTKVTFEKEQLEEMLKKKQISFDEDMKTLKNDYNKLLEEHQNVKKDFEIAKSHVEDLEIMTTHSEKKHAETMKELRQTLAEKDKEMGHMGTQKLQVEVAKEQLEKELASAQDLVDSLKEREETLQATLDFTQTQMTQVEDTLKSIKSEKEELHKELQSVQCKLDQEKERGQHLKEQLTQQEGELQKELLQVQGELEVRDGELEAARAHNTAASDRISNMELQLQQKDADVHTHLKLQHELKEGLQSAQKQLAATKEEKDAVDRSMEEVSTQLADVTAQLESLHTQLTASEAANSLLRDEMDQIENEMQQKEMELENASMDLDQYIVLNGDLEQQNRNFSNMISQLREEAQSLNQKVDDLSTQKLEIVANNEQLTSQKSQLEETVSQLNQKNTKLETKCEELTESNRKLSEKVDKLEEIIRAIKEASKEQHTEMEKEGQELHEKYEMEVQEKDDQLTSLREYVCELQGDLATRDNDVKEVEEKLVKEQGHRLKFTHLYDEMRDMYNESKSREEKLQSQLDEQLSKLTSLEQTESRLAEVERQMQAQQAQITDKEGQIAQAQSLADRIMAEKQNLESKMSEQQEAADQLSKDMNTVNQELQENIADRERLQSVLRSKDLEKQELVSKCAQFEEKFTVMEKQYTELQKKCEELSTENARLVGHQNPKQKIQHHMKIKDENNVLRERNAQLEKELAAYRLQEKGGPESCIPRARGAHTPSRSHHPSHGDSQHLTPGRVNKKTPLKTPLKENLHPL